MGNSLLTVPEPKLLPTFNLIGKEGKGYIAVPAFEGSLAEAKNACNQTSPNLICKQKTRVCPCIEKKRIEAHHVYVRVLKLFEMFHKQPCSCTAPYH